MPFALTTPAAVTLRVRRVSAKGKALGRLVTVGKALRKAGKNAISWNRKLDGKRVRAGSYRLVVQTTGDAGPITSNVVVHLR